MNRQLIFRTGGKVTKCRVEKNPEIRRKSSESGGVIAIRILDILAFAHLLHSGLHPDCTLAYLREDNCPLMPEAQSPETGLDSTD